MKRHGARLGQHFLHNKYYAHRLAESLNIQENETILEIGPGKGMLTRELLSFGKVVAIEKDDSLVTFLSIEFATEIASGRLRVIQGDIRDIKPSDLGLAKGKYVLGANIPYYITGEIIRMFLEDEHTPRAMSLLIQKEVAQRIVSPKGSLLSIAVQIYGSPSIVCTVSAGNFSPPPSVDSAILCIDEISKDRFHGIGEHDFFSVIRAGFGSKRKTLLNNLASRFEKQAVLNACAYCGVDPISRPETLSVETWLQIAQSLIARNPSS